MRRFPTACWLLCTVALAGCDSSASSEPPPVATIEPEPKQTSQPLPGPEIDPDPRALMMRLAPHAVSDDNFVRRVLYTWTTAEQAKEVRQDKQLLRRSNDAEGKIAWFDAQIRKRSDRMSKLLQTPPFDKRRFAWTRPWATSMGGYGDVLVRMELKPDAVIGKLDTSAKQSWTFADLNGTPVPEAQVLADPQRLAAVFHVYRPSGAEGEPTTPYREYVVVNEAMLSTWEIDTPATKGAILEDHSLMTLLMAHVQDEPMAVSDQASLIDRASQRWKEDQPTNLLDRYVLAVQFPNDEMVPTMPKLTAIRDRLEALTPGGVDPIRHEVIQKPPVIQKAAPPPPAPHPVKWRT